ncbi:MAG TPA: amidohydrolase family protein [Solirubrobacteraceae bacterium]|nr:amidohydrolase family protein [Solirubrobacteraceae bacterium]
MISPAAVDVHAHFLPPSYRAALKRAGIDRPDGFPFVPKWSAGSALALMDEVGIGRALLSISSPGLSFVAGAERSELARTVNAEGAAAVQDHWQRLGLLASLPLPDVEAALEEITHASEVLHADGFVLMTNYEGVYLGDKRLEPVMEELDRRGALVTLHPTAPPEAKAVANGLPYPMMEFIFDTTRAVANLVVTGTLARHPRLNVIVPHVGSALPSLADRLNGFAKLPFTHKPSERIDVYETLARLYYDVAGTPFPHALRGLLGIAPAEQLLYGSDTPFTPNPAIQASAKALLETDLLDDNQKRGMFTDNAQPLLPRLAQSPA